MAVNLIKLETCKLWSKQLAATDNEELIAWCKLAERKISDRMTANDDKMPVVIRLGIMVPFLIDTL